MGDYNPHAPSILGQEWVPIRNAHYVPDGVVERGYEFSLDALTTPVSGAFYVSEPAENHLAGSCDFISVYPSGYEALTGPVKKVRIRPSAVVVTNPGSIDITAGVAALYSSEDPTSIIFEADTGTSSQLQVSFDTEAYGQLLLGKRILDVRLRYSFQSFNVNNAENLTFTVHNQNSFKSVAFPAITEVISTTEQNKISTLSITELNPAWNSSALFRSQRTVLPWRFQELNRFRSGASAAEALTIFIQNDTELFSAGLGFLEMEVLYCEETRVLYGGFRTYDSNYSNSPEVVTEFYGIGAIAVQLYDPVTFTPGKALAAGSYVTTIYHRNMSARSILQGASEIRALREYYQLPRQRGVHVRQTLVEDAEFTVAETDVLTQLTLHTATQIVTGCHPYGASLGAPIYGSRTAIQEIEDNPSAGTGVQYPQVRFYARRYGNTTVPLTLVDVATGTNTVSINIADFDALDEIVDGWREVTLRFAVPPTFPVTSDDVDWRWQAPGELVGNQWQILVADGPTGSWQPNPTAAATGPATYWAPNGSAVALTWQSPAISGSVSDTTSDAVLIFSQDPPSVTGFAVTTARQTLDVALRCDSPPGCVPTGLSYVHATWSFASACDSFDRDDELGWNTPDVGSDWIIDEGSTSDVYVANNVGNLSLSAAGTGRSVRMPISVANIDLLIRNVTWPIIPIATAPGAANPVQTVRIRSIDANNYIEGQIFRTDTNATTIRLVQVLAGVETVAPLPFSLVAGALATADVSIRLQAFGSVCRMKVWLSHLPEPSIWSLEFTVTVLGAGAIRIHTDIGANSTNTFPLVSTYDNLIAVPNPALYDASLEIQRFDSIDGEWRTVLQSNGPCVAQFNDYEARVGVLSSYRIRTLNALEFAGPWVTGSATVPSPGVQISGSANSALIFTSNADPDSNLAYIMQWNGTPVEEFLFPEADTVILQHMFGRDFAVAFHPLERGGDRFDRTILVNAAAIALPSLANFRGLRDLAWADLDYVCVRDELGNRWFATVIVPSGEVRDNRTIYLARISVHEVTDTPSPIDH